MTMGTAVNTRSGASFLIARYMKGGSSMKSYSSILKVSRSGTVDSQAGSMWTYSFLASLGGGGSSTSPGGRHPGVPCSIGVDVDGGVFAGGVTSGITTVGGDLAWLVRWAARAAFLCSRRRRLRSSFWREKRQPSWFFAYVAGTIFSGFPLVLVYAQFTSRVNVDLPWCILKRGSSTARFIVGFKKAVIWLSNSRKCDILATLTKTEW